MHGFNVTQQKNLTLINLKTWKLVHVLGISITFTRVICKVKQMKPIG